MGTKLPEPKAILGGVTACHAKYTAMRKAKSANLAPPSPSTRLHQRPTRASLCPSRLPCTARRTAKRLAELAASTARAAKRRAAKHALTVALAVALVLPSLSLPASLEAAPGVAADAGAKVELVMSPAEASNSIEGGSGTVWGDGDRQQESAQPLGQRGERAGRRVVPGAGDAFRTGAGGATSPSLLARGGPTTGVSSRSAFVGPWRVEEGAIQTPGSVAAASGGRGIVPAAVVETPTQEGAVQVARSLLKTVVHSAGDIAEDFGSHIGVGCIAVALVVGRFSILFRGPDAHWLLTSSLGA